MIRLEDVSKSFGAQTILENANLYVNPGEKVGFVGSNGAGKTTLLRIIEGLDEIDGGKMDIKGRVRVGTLRQEMESTDRSILEETLRGHNELTTLRKERNQLQAQLANASDATVQQTLAIRWGEVDHRLEELGSYEAESKAGSILLGLGFSKEALSQPINAFSGGWRMRVALAQLLFSNPDLFLLDEPTNHLDLESVAWFENYLRKLPQTFIAVSHDRGFLNRVTKITVELDRGILTRFHGSFDQYIEQKMALMELQEKKVAQQQKKIEAISQFINRFRAQANKARQVQSRVKQLNKIDILKKNQKRTATVKIRLPEPEKSALNMISVRKLCKGFDNHQVLSNVQFEFERGHKIGLLGPNGAGKTTFLKLLANELQPDLGEVVLGDRVRTAYFTQHALDALDPKATVLEETSKAAPKTMKETALRTLLGNFLFSGDDVLKQISVLSGGEKARVALVRMFLSGANLLLLDEPTNHLDMESRIALAEALESYKGSLILVTHDRDLMQAVCGNYYVVAKEKVTLLEDPLEHYLESVTLERSGPSEKKQPSSDPRKNSREFRRRASQIRGQLNRDTKQKRQQLKTLEVHIHKLESEQKKLDIVLASSELYQESDKEKLKKTLENNQKTNNDLEKAMAQWEEIVLSIEEMEENANTTLAQL